MGKHGKPLVSSKYMTQARPGHPTAHSDGRVRVHRAVLFDAIGPGAHECHWCGAEIEWFADGQRELVADHVDENTWNNSPQNLVASCQPCNSARRLRAMTACTRGHEYTPENTYRPTRGGRQCRECIRMRDRARRRERRVA